MTPDHETLRTTLPTARGHELRYLPDSPRPMVLPADTCVVIWSAEDRCWLLHARETEGREVLTSATRLVVGGPASRDPFEYALLPADRVDQSDDSGDWCVIDAAGQVLYRLVDVPDVPLWSVPRPDERLRLGDTWHDLEEGVRALAAA